MKILKIRFFKLQLKIFSRQSRSTNDDCLMEEDLGESELVEVAGKEGLTPEELAAAKPLPGTTGSSKIPGWLIGLGIAVVGVIFTVAVVAALCCKSFALKINEIFRKYPKNILWNAKKN